MNKLFTILFCALLFMVGSNVTLAQTNVITVNLGGNFGLNYPNWPVIWTPIATARTVGGRFVPQPLTYTGYTDTNFVARFTNVVAGSYSLQFPRSLDPKALTTSTRITVLTNSEGEIDAADLPYVATALGPNFYTAEQINDLLANFTPSTGGPGGGTNFVFITNSYTVYFTNRVNVTNSITVNTTNTVNLTNAFTAADANWPALTNGTAAMPLNLSLATYQWGWLSGMPANTLQWSLQSTNSFVPVGDWVPFTNWVFANIGGGGGGTWSGLYGIPANVLQWSLQPTNGFLTSIAAALAYQPLNANLTAWSLQTTNGFLKSGDSFTVNDLVITGTCSGYPFADLASIPANVLQWSLQPTNSFLSTAAAAAAYQPLNANLTAWSLQTTNGFLTSIAAALAYQPLNANVTAWSLQVTNSFFTSAQAVLKQPASAALTNLANGDASALANLLSTNSVEPAFSWPGLTNTFNVNNDGNHLFVMTGAAAVTNLTWAGTWAVMTLSNATTTATNFYVNFPARAIGTATTNVITVAPGKMAILSIRGRTGAFTNYMTATQQ